MCLKHVIAADTASSEVIGSQRYGRLRNFFQSLLQNSLQNLTPRLERGQRPHCGSPTSSTTISQPFANHTAEPVPNYGHNKHHAAAGFRACSAGNSRSRPAGLSRCHEEVSTPSSKRNMTGTNSSTASCTTRTQVISRLSAGTLPTTSIASSSAFTPHTSSVSAKAGLPRAKREVSLCATTLPSPWS